MVMRISPHISGEMRFVDIYAEGKGQGATPLHWPKSIAV
jgi:hypothetical protein